MIRLIIFILMLHSTCYAQIELKGVIVDSATGNPLPYANLGFPGKEVGTVSNSLGQFELLVPVELESFPLVISHMGYKEGMLIPSNLSNEKLHLQIALEPTFQKLEEVAVVGTKESFLGNRPSGDTVKGYFHAEGLGGEAGCLIPNEGKTQLMSFNLNILKCTFDTLRFRLNFYTRKWNKPGDEIPTAPILFDITSADTGFFTVSLSTKNVVVRDDFFCTVELVEILGEAPKDAKLLFSAAPDRDGILVRKMISFGKWEKFKGYNLCYWFTVKK